MVPSDVQHHWPTSIDLDGFGDGCPTMSSPIWRSATWRRCVQGYAWLCSMLCPEKKRARASRVHAGSQTDQWSETSAVLLLDPTWMAMLKRIPSGNRFTRTNCDNLSNTRNKRCCMILPTKIVQLRRAHSGLSLNEIIVDKQLFVLFALDCFHSHLDIVRGWYFCSIIYAAPWQLLWQPEGCRTEENIARLSAACCCVQHFLIKATGNGKMVELATPIVARVWLHSGRSGLLSAVATSPEASG